MSRWPINQGTKYLSAQKIAHTLDLIMAYEGRCVTAAFDFDQSRPGIATGHVAREVGREQVRIHASQHEDSTLAFDPLLRH